MKNEQLPKPVAEGRFRDDLYHRLKAVELEIPPLRARREDVIPLAEHIIAWIVQRSGKRIPFLLPAARAALCGHPWPGNTKESRHRPERAIGRCGGAAQLSARALFPEQTLLVSPESRIASLAERASARNGCRSSKRFGTRMARSAKPRHCSAFPAQPFGRRCAISESRNGGLR